MSDRAELRLRPRDVSAPEALVIACTDPILDGSLMQHLQSIPVVFWRVAGPIVLPFSAACANTQEAIDWAINQVGVREIVVCGHLPAAALRDLVAGQATADDRHLASVRATGMLVHEKYGPLDSDDLHQAVVEENVFAQLANLRTYPAVIAALARAELDLQGWIFDAAKPALYEHSTSVSSLRKRIEALTPAPAMSLPWIDPRDICLE